MERLLFDLSLNLRKNADQILKPPQAQGQGANLRRTGGQTGGLDGNQALDVGRDEHHAARNQVSSVGEMEEWKSVVVERVSGVYDRDDTWIDKGICDRGIKLVGFFPGPVVRAGQ